MLWIYYPAMLCNVFVERILKLYVPGLMQLDSVCVCLWMHVLEKESVVSQGMTQISVDVRGVGHAATHMPQPGRE